MTGVAEVLEERTPHVQLVGDRVGGHPLGHLGASAAHKTTQKAHSSVSLLALSKLGELVDRHYRIVSPPPVIVPTLDLHAMYGYSPDQLHEVIHREFREYRMTLQEDRRHLFERFEISDMARKVVGVGSVGTRAFIVLLPRCDERDPLLCKVMEATASVLEDHLSKPGSHPPRPPTSAVTSAPR